MDGVFDPTAHDNDIFHPNVSGLKTYEIDIFNRWGEMIFSSNDLEHGWDGTYNGTPQDIGTYYYYISYVCNDGNEYQKKGDVTLIR